MKEILEIIPNSLPSDNRQLPTRVQRDQSITQEIARPLKYKRGIFGKNRGIVSALYRVNRQVKKAKRLKVRRA
jgi:hypothetical protein